MVLMEFATAIFCRKFVAIVIDHDEGLTQAEVESKVANST